MHHRLLAINVLAGAHGIDGYFLVPVVGRGHDDGIDVFPIQQFTVAAGGVDVLSPTVLGILEPSVREVADRHQFDAGTQRGDRIPRTHAASADEADVEVVTRKESAIF
jgi:hypothetical protein